MREYEISFNIKSRSGEPHNATVYSQGTFTVFSDNLKNALKKLLEDIEKGEVQ